MLTDEVLELAKDVDESAVERLEELADERFVLACARFDIRLRRAAAGARTPLQ